MACLSDDLIAGCTNNRLTNELPPKDDWSVLVCHWWSTAEDGAVIMPGGGNYPLGQMGPPGCGRAD